MYSPVVGCYVPLTSLWVSATDPPTISLSKAYPPPDFLRYIKQCVQYTWDKFPNVTRMGPRWLQLHQFLRQLREDSPVEAWVDQNILILGVPLLHVKRNCVMVYDEPQASVKQEVKRSLPQLPPVLVNLVEQYRDDIAWKSPDEALHLFLAWLQRTQLPAWLRAALGPPFLMNLSL